MIRSALVRVSLIHCALFPQVFNCMMWECNSRVLRLCIILEDNSQSTI